MEALMCKGFHFIERPILQGILILVCVMLTQPGGVFADDTDGYIESAKKYIKDNNAKGAVIELKNALQQDANNSEARLLLGKIYLERGDVLSAEKELRYAMKTGLSRNAWIGDLGKALVLKGDAQGILDEIAVVDKDAVELKVKIHALRSQAQLILRNFDEARAEIAEADKLATETPDILLGFARLAALDKDSALTLEYVEKAINKDGKNIDALMMRGGLYRQDGKSEKALEVYTRLLKNHPNYWLALLAKIDLHISIKEYAAAEDSIKELKKIQPKNPSGLYYEAVLAYQKKDYELAQNNLQLILRSIPNHQPSNLILGSIYYTKGEFGAADAHLTSYLKSNPKYVPALKLMAAIKLKLGQIDASISTLESMLDTEGADPQFLALLGTAYIQKKDYSRGTEYLERAARLAPDVAAIRTQLAMSNLGSGDTSQAITQLETAVDMGQDVLQADVMLIIVHLKEKEFDKSIQAAKKLIDKRPDDPMPHNLISAAYMGMGDAEAMRRHLNKALEIDPGFSVARINLAKLNEKEGDLVNAKKQYLKVISVDPKNINGMLGLSRMADKAGDSNEALDWIKKAHEENSSAIEPGVLLTRYYLRKGDGLKALSLARELNGRRSGLPVVLDLLGSSQLLAGETSSAVKTFEKIVEIKSEDHTAYYSLANAHVIAKNFQQAIKYFNKSLELNNEFLPSLFKLAAVELETGNINEAEKIAKKIQEKHPEKAVGFQLEGDILRKKGDANKAIEKYEYAYKKQPSYQLAQVIYKQYIELEDPTGAINILEKHLSTMPDDFRIRLMLAGEYQNQGRDKEAIQEYEKLAELKTENLVIWNNLAWLYFKENDTRAIKSAKKAYEIAPKRPEVVDTYGWIVLHHGNATEGLRLIQDAAIHAPHIVQIRYHLAVALHKTGRNDEAYKELERILRAGNSFPERNDAKSLYEKLKDK